MRTIPCIRCGFPRSEAAHCRIGFYCMGEKPGDDLVNPLCHACHRTAKHAQHNRNEEEWWAGSGIDPFVSAAFFYKHTGDYATCERYALSHGRLPF